MLPTFSSGNAIGEILFGPVSEKPPAFAPARSEGVVDKELLGSDSCGPPDFPAVSEITAMVANRHPVFLDFPCWREGEGGVAPPRSLALRCKNLTNPH